MQPGYLQFATGQRSAGRLGAENFFFLLTAGGALAGAPLESCQSHF